MKREEIKIKTATKEAAEIDCALARATLYSALALGCRPPTDETVARLCSEEGAAALAGAAALIDLTQETDLGAMWVLLPKDSMLSSLIETHQRLFGHTARGGVPPYETEYGAEALFQQPQEMGDLMGFYRAFGLTMNVEARERPDHVSCECEFLSFLALKEAYALEREDTAVLEETRKAERFFLRDHLGRFLPAFANKLGREATDGLYRALARLARGFIAAECARFGVPAGPENLTLRPADDERVPMACGSGGCPGSDTAGSADETE
jgi:DMSO reductase family type II enzyme chaperone